MKVGFTLIALNYRIQELSFTRKADLTVGFVNVDILFIKQAVFEQFENLII
jgi:hypothetical protein